MHVFALLVFVGGAALEGPSMLFAGVTACNYHAREIVRRYGHLTSPKHYALAYCVPRFLENPDQHKVYRYDE